MKATFATRHGTLSVTGYDVMYTSDDGSTALLSRGRRWDHNSDLVQIPPGRSEDGGFSRYARYFGPFFLLIETRISGEAGVGVGDDDATRLAA
jgi:hypothetical protein